MFFLFYLFPETDRLVCKVQSYTFKMIDISGGQATAAAIPGASLIIFDGMGHGLTKPLWPEFATRIANLIHQVEASVFSQRMLVK